MPGSKVKIMEAAKELFHLRGYRATGLEEILTQSGVCKSNFYYHFKSKDELALQVLEESILQMEECYIGPSLRNRDLRPAERITLFFTKMIEFLEGQQLQKGCFFGNLTLELSDHHEGIRSMLSIYFGELERAVEDILREGTDNGDFSLPDIGLRETAVSIVSMLQGGILLAKGHKDISPLRYNLHLLVKLLGADNPDCMGGD